MIVMTMIPLRYSLRKLDQFAYDNDDDDDNDDDAVDDVTF